VAQRYAAMALPAVVAGTSQTRAVSGLLGCPACSDEGRCRVRCRRAGVYPARPLTKVAVVPRCRRGGVQCFRRARARRVRFGEGTGLRTGHGQRHATQHAYQVADIDAEDQQVVVWWCGGGGAVVWCCRHELAG